MKIERMDHQGRGIGYLNEKIVFVSNALIDENVEINITNDSKKYSEAVVKKYNKISNLRVEPICPYYELCGGCDLMHLSYKEQLKYKQDKVENILRRKVNTIVPTSDLYYRNKITLKVNKKVGLYKKQSHELIYIDKCYLVNEKINNLIKIINSIDLNHINEIVIKTTSYNETMVIFKGEEVDISKLKDTATSIYLNDKLLFGKPHIKEKIGNYDFVISPTSFFQVNQEQTYNLYNKISEYIDGGNILDLYCGTGTIGIFVSNKCYKVLGIEINNEAIEDAKINAELNHIKNISFKVSDACKEIYTNYDTIIIDPPRGGMDKEGTLKLNESGAKEIIYVSCNPITLKRDVDLLTNYDLIEVTPFDMFPNTYHVECVCKLERNK